jgi:multicomponent K+:H+ antiporter subunit A
MFALLVTGHRPAGGRVRALLHVARRPGARFFAFLLAFMGAMLGVVLSGNLIQLVFFWELTSLFSFLLIGYWHHRKDARAARAWR